MFNKLISKVKVSKTLRFSLNDPRFQIGNITSKFSPKQLRLPTLDATKVIEFANARFIGLQGYRIGFTSSRLLAVLRARGQNIRKYVNKRTLVGSLMSSLGLYYAYEYFPLNTKIALSYDQTKFNDELVSSLKHLNDTHFYPNLLGTTALSQSIMNKVPPEAAVDYIREPLLLPDGGQIMLDWALPSKQVNAVGTHLHGRYYPYQPAADTKIMFIIHGLTGGSETAYIQSLVENSRRNGYRVVVMNQRGINQPLLTPFPFHGGTLHDLEAGLAHVKKKYPNAPIVAVGTSFGGNQLIRYLAQEGEKTNIVGGVMLAAPFNIVDCVDQIQNTVYETFFIRNYLQNNFLPNIAMFESLKESHGVDIDQILKVKSLRDYHSHFTVKLFDYKDVGEYFETTKVSDAQINNVKVPLLVLHAKDDPIAVHKSIPIEKLKKNPNIIYAETSRGGHLCWFTGFKPKRWYSMPTIEFLDKVLEMKTSDNNKENVMQ